MPIVIDVSAIEPLFKNWKTTASGLCSFVIAASLSSAVVSALSPQHAALLATAAGLAKAFIGFIQTDGTQVTVPASSTIQSTTTIQTPPEAK